MRFLGWLFPRWSWAFALVLATLVPACGTRPKPGPNPPGPTPTPVPPKPPGPPPPTPTPVGHVLTPAEYAAVAVGTSGDSLLASFGAPFARNPVSTPGTLAWLYFASTEAGEQRVAEFWIRDGRVTNKLRL